MSLLDGVLGHFRKPSRPGNFEGDYRFIIDTDGAEVWIGLQSEPGDRLLKRYPLDQLPLLIANLQEAYKAAKAAQTKLRA